MKRYIILGVVVLAGIIFSVQYLNANSELKTDSDKFSYIVGLNLGTSFKAQEMAVNPSVILKGIKDGIAGSKPLLSKEQQKVIMQAVQKEMIAKMQAKQKVQGAANTKTGAAFLAKNVEDKDVKTTKSGLQYKVVTKGTGPHPLATDAVTVDYEGTLINGTVFDSSYKRGQPATFKVNQVIPGWTEALQLMRKGSTWMLYIPAKLAYGAQAMGQSIPPNSTLIFKVHLISFKK
jgi:FKBP-type peptidyl-prolyl cis-trans isomerase FklB